jgi:hypothetical protein
VDGADLRVDFWRDLDGDVVVPPSGVGAVDFELFNRTNYLLQIERGASGALVRGNDLARGDSDSISVYADRCVVSGNRVRDTRDMAITVQGDHSLVEGNQIRRPGAGAVWVQASGCSVQANQVVGPWTTRNAAERLGAINVVGGEYKRPVLASDNVVAGNHLDGGGFASSRWGIVVRGDDGRWLSGVDNIVRANTVIGESDGGIQLDLGPARTVIDDNATSVITRGYDPVAGTGADPIGGWVDDRGGWDPPEGALAAAPGSRWTTADGDTHTKIWGTGPHGWASAVTDAWDPGELADLWGWWDPRHSANTISAGVITALADRSSAGRDLTQQSGETGPTLNESTSGSNNGRAVARFDATTQTRLRTATFTGSDILGRNDGGSPRPYVLAYAARIDTTAQILIAGGSDTDLRAGTVAVTGSYGLYVGSMTPGGLGGDPARSQRWQVVTIVSDGTTTTLTLHDQTPTAIAPGADIVVEVDQLTVGARANATA